MEGGGGELLRPQVGVLPPLGEVGGGDGGASTLSPHIGQGVRLEEEEGLELLNVIHAVTDNPGQAGCADLLKF